jgi:hypothetical protein
MYTSPNITRVIKSQRMRWAGHVVHMREMRSTQKIFIRKPEGKRQPGGPRHKWEDNIRIDLREIG